MMFTGDLVNTAHVVWGPIHLNKYRVRQIIPWMLLTVTNASALLNSHTAIIQNSGATLTILDQKKLASEVDKYQPLKG